MFIIMVLKKTEDDYSVDTESLFYITDSVADENGQVEFSYSIGDKYIIKIFGKNSIRNVNLGVVNAVNLISAFVTLAVLKLSARTSILEDLATADVVNDGIIIATDALKIL